MTNKRCVMLDLMVTTEDKVSCSARALRGSLPCTRCRRRIIEERTLSNHGMLSVGETTSCTCARFRLRKLPFLRDLEDHGGVWGKTVVGEVIDGEVAESSDLKSNEEFATDEGEFWAESD